MEELTACKNANLGVCLLNDSFPPVIDGVANTICNYASIIQSETEGRAMVATPYYPHAVDNYEFPVFRYRSVSVGSKFEGYRVGYPFSASVVDEIKKQKPQIIHTHCPFASNILARALREALDIPIVFTYHTKYDVDIAKTIDFGLIQNAAIKLMIANIESCDEVWVVSEGAGENLRSLGFKGEYHIMENGVDFPRGRVPDERVDEVRALHGLSTAIPTFLFVGRMKWYKGIKIILDGLRKAKERGCKFKMMFVGDGEDMGEIKGYTDGIGLADECIFTGAIYDREKLRAYFCAADLFLFPSTYDTNGIVVREAAACSLASVLVRGSCAAEGVIDNQNAFLIDENAESLAEAVINACQNPEKLPEVGEAAAKELFISWHEAVQKAYARYQVVVDNYKKGSTNRRERFSDEFITMMADSMDAVQKVRKMREKLKRNQSRWKGNNRIEVRKHYKDK
ncbi:MAG: glycosyltransferase [Oscillospiraceae bacterium]